MTVLYFHFEWSVMFIMLSKAEFICRNRVFKMSSIPVVVTRHSLFVRSLFHAVEYWDREVPAKICRPRWVRYEALSHCVCVWINISVHFCELLVSSDWTCCCACCIVSNARLMFCILAVNSIKFHPTEQMALTGEQPHIQCVWHISMSNITYIYSICINRRKYCSHCVNVFFQHLIQVETIK